MRDRGYCCPWPEYGEPSSGGSFFPSAGVYADMGEDDNGAPSMKPVLMVGRGWWPPCRSREWAVATGCDDEAKGLPGVAGTTGDRAVKCPGSGSDCALSWWWWWLRSKSDAPRFFGSPRDDPWSTSPVRAIEAVVGGVSSGGVRMFGLSGGDVDVLLEAALPNDGDM